ncbi:MAG TPA: hypothetical protein VFP50_15545 [Anaeromyxobacteraceae bacterium]|nr:hypothetical protein [Anaeromyxobacteraceae bacterium]
MAATMDACIRMVWGAASDVRLYDLWRTCGERRARRYLAAQVRRGVDLRGGVTPSQALAALGVEAM